MSKEAEETKGGGDDAVDVPVITPTEISVEPNMCPVGDALSLDIEFKSDRDIPNAQWEVTVRILFAVQVTPCLLCGVVLLWRWPGPLFDLAWPLGAVHCRLDTKALHHQCVGC